MKTIRSIALWGALAAAWGAAAQNPPAMFSQRDPRYRLQPDDKISVRFRYTPEFNQTVTVQPDGFVTLQVAGDLKLGGLTAPEAAAAIAAKASTRLNQPEVSVALEEFVRPYFTTAGEVAHPGRFDLTGRVTVTEALAISGWFKDSAKHSQVVLVRRIGPDTAEVKVLNVKRTMRARNVHEDPEVKPGDLLIVPQNLLSKVERYMRWGSPAVYGLMTRR